MLDEVLPLQLITATPGGSSEFRDRDHQLYEVHRANNRYFPFPCMGSFTSPGIDTR